MERQLGSSGEGWQGAAVQGEVSGASVWRGPGMLGREVKLSARKGSATSFDLMASRSVSRRKMSSR